MKKFFFIFCIIFVAFLFALNNIFWYYQADVRSTVEVINNDDNANNIPNAEQSFSTYAKIKLQEAFAAI